MRNTIKTAALFALISLAAGTARAAALAAMKVTTLDNGLKVIVQEDHSTNLVALDVWVGAGTINETDETSGVSHIIEHVLFRATDKRATGQVDMEIESLGSTLEARTGRDWAHFFTVTDRRYFDKALDVVSDVVEHPKLSQADIDHERDIILDEIARKESDQFMVLSDALFASAFKTHPYRLPVEGKPEAIAKVSREAVVDYYNRLYIPGNMWVVIVGDITPDQAVASVKKAFADLKKKSSSLQRPGLQIPDEHKRLVIKKNTKLTYIGVAFVGPAVSDRPDVFSMDVLMSHLGIGYQSWLASELRDTEKLAIEVSGEYLTQRDQSLVLLSASTEPAKAKQAEDAMLAKIASLRTTPITGLELDRAKRWLLGTYAFDVETFSGRATNIGFYNAVGAPDIAENYKQDIKSVSVEDVTNVANRYLDPTKAVVVVIGP